MNYLTYKINKYIINEIQTYLLLSKRNVAYDKDICMKNLIDKTCYINDRLQQNICCNDDFRWYENLDNSRIIRFDSSQWTIRKRIINNKC